MKKATFWQRMGVYLIDMVVLAVESFPFLWQGSGGIGYYISSLVFLPEFSMDAFRSAEGCLA